MGQKVSLDAFARSFAEDFPVRISNKDAKEAVVRMFALIAENMQDGNEVNIPSFGKFKLRDTPAREGRNPMTGETIKIPAKKAIKFTPSKPLKEALS